MQDRARVEARAALGASATESVPWGTSGGLGGFSREVINSLPLATCIIYETMRLFPPVPIIARTASCDVTLTPIAPAGGTSPLSPTNGGPLRIQAGTGIVIDIPMLHRDKVSRKQQRRL